MPPKTKKRKGTKESEGEILINFILTEVLFKYRDDEDNDSNVGMFEDEDQKIKLKHVEAIVKEVDVIKWDPSVLVLINEGERESGLINIEKLKLILMTLETVEKQMGDIEYLFKTFSDPQTNQITHESLSKALKHLNIRESPDKMALLLAFAHEQSFLQLVVNEQTTGQSMSMGADKSGVGFEEFKRTFIRSTFLTNK